STQCEGAAPASDWWAWERAGHAPESGHGNDFARRHAEDFALLAGLGLTHHRLSVEWARLEPEPGRPDRAEVDRYRGILTAARGLAARGAGATHPAAAQAAARVRQTSRPVASILALSPAVALVDVPATLAAVDRFYASMWSPGLGLCRDGVLRVPGVPDVKRP